MISHVVKQSLTLFWQGMGAIFFVILIIYSVYKYGRIDFGD